MVFLSGALRLRTATRDEYESGFQLVRAGVAPGPFDFNTTLRKRAQVLNPKPHIVGDTMDPLTARMRCLELADDLLSDTAADADDVLTVATAYWEWVMQPFRLVDDPEANETRQ